MKRRTVLWGAVVVLGCALLWPLVATLLRSTFHLSYLDLASVSLGAILLTVACGRLAVARKPSDHRGSTTLDLDHFLPIIRRRKKNEPERVASWPIRAGSRWLGDSWFTNLETGRPGRFRKLLKWIGPSVVSSPFRRVIQGAFFFAYLWLFFYVCWPYSARPALPGQSSADWKMIAFDQSNSEFRFSTNSATGKSGDHWVPPKHQPLYASRPSTQGIPVEAAIPLLVNDVVNGDLLLRPQTELAPEQFDLLLFSDSTWELHEVAPDAWPTHYADDLESKEFVPSELYLAIDPLVSLSTAIASRKWVWSLACAAIILIVCIAVPRGFCGYICPLGTVIDLFDWTIGRHIKRFRVRGSQQWWVNTRYYLLLATLISSMCGLLISGFFSAIPVVTRGLLFLGEPIQSGLWRGWHLVAPLHWGHIFSICLFLTVLSLGFLSPRFWCKYVCPTGAIFSLGNLFRVTERKVESTCVGCDKCVQICPFDAIEPDFTTKTLNCTLCQTCAGVCPTQAIKFVDRWAIESIDKPHEHPEVGPDKKRRRFLGWSVGTAAAIGVGATVAIAEKSLGKSLVDKEKNVPVRPPGSVPENLFVDLCIRCGQCYKACPNGVLQPMGFQRGLEGLWTPEVDANWAGCESSCNACGQVCPTGAIRAIPMEEKRVARMGLAIVNEKTCLPWADTGDCQLCVDECHAAGYHAIEFTYVHTQVDAQGLPLEDSGRLAPVVLQDKCVGCGLCQTRCYGINVAEEKLLDNSAIIIRAGEGREDRLVDGSYRKLRSDETIAAQGQHNADQGEEASSGYFVPSSPQDADLPDGDPADLPKHPDSSSDPFGLTPGNEAPSDKNPMDKTPADDDPFGISPF